MPLTRERKEELVEDYVDLLGRSRAIIFTEYRGLNNTSMTKLRRDVREANGVFRVTKLTLLERALEQSGMPVPDTMAGTPLAIGFCLEEIPGVAKVLTDFAKDNELMAIYGGMMASGEILTAGQISSLASLPPLEVVQAQILGLLDAPASNLVGVIQAGMGQIVNVLNAYVDQGEGAPA